jgi:transcriptional regulator with XRE-family HTH domain
MEPFATNLRSRAERLGLSHAEVARRAGLSERRYGNYVTGRREPDLSTLLRIAAALETSPDELLGVTVGEEAQTREELLSAVVPALSRLTVERLRLVTAIVAALAR